MLPKKRPVKWSAGLSPGEYGSPPTATNLRKGGGEEVDPLASDDFMWKKEFVGCFKRSIQEPQSSIETIPAKEEHSGFLSFNRVMSLDSLDVDLSKELSTPSKHDQVQETEAATENSVSKRVKWRSAPKCREQEKWDRATKAATGGSDVIFRDIGWSYEDPEILAAKTKEKYDKLKMKSQILTLGVGSVGLLSSYVSYSPEIATRGAIGQPRLLVLWY